ncbi:MAG TPA: hypothetical protein VIY48_06075, partial [Candidatus Paceibacterota bacterium]
FLLFQPHNHGMDHPDREETAVDVNQHLMRGEEAACEVNSLTAVCSHRYRLAIALCGVLVPLVYRVQKVLHALSFLSRVPNARIVPDSGILVNLLSVRQL